MQSANLVHLAKQVVQTVVITGGSQGMGKAAAKLLAKRGANVVIVARTKQKLEAAMEGIAVGDHSHSLYSFANHCS